MHGSTLDACRLRREGNVETREARFASGLDQAANSIPRLSFVAPLVPSASVAVATVHCKTRAGPLSFLDQGKCSAQGIARFTRRLLFCQAAQKLHDMKPTRHTQLWLSLSLSLSSHLWSFSHSLGWWRTNLFWSSFSCLLPKALHLYAAPLVHLDTVNFDLLTSSTSSILLFLVFG